nr:MAG TPA: cell division protein [Caudoviricetes sp.]
MSLTISIIISVLTFILSVLISCVSVSMKVGKYTEKIENTERNHNNLSSELKELRNKMQEQVAAISKIEGLITPMLNQNLLQIGNVSRKKSPRMLNTLGCSLFEKMNGKQFLDDNKNTLYAYIDKSTPHTALDVEVQALAACISISESEVFNPIKVFVYNCPIQKNEEGEDFELTLGGAMFILSLPLRDMYLKDHPQIEK